MADPAGLGGAWAAVQAERQAVLAAAAALAADPNVERNPADAPLQELTPEQIAGIAANLLQEQQPPAGD